MLKHFSSTRNHPIIKPDSARCIAVKQLNDKRATNWILLIKFIAILWRDCFSSEIDLICHIFTARSEHNCVRWKWRIQIYECLLAMICPICMLGVLPWMWESWMRGSFFFRKEGNIKAFLRLWCRNGTWNWQAFYRKQVPILQTWLK